MASSTGHSDDQTPVPEVSLQKYSENIVRVLDSRSEPVILVGHSMGSIVISEVAEQRPDKIEILIYLSAFLLPSGSAALHMAQQNTESLLAQNLQVDEERGVATPPKESTRDLFYGDCADGDATWATARLMDEDLLPHFLRPSP